MRRPRSRVAGHLAAVFPSANASSSPTVSWCGSPPASWSTRGVCGDARRSSASSPSKAGSPGSSAGVDGGFGMTLVLALVLAAADPAAAYGEVDRAKLTAEDARARIATVVEPLNDAGMPRHATVLLAALASDPQQSEGVRTAARAQLAARVGADGALAQLLISDRGDPGKLPPAVAVTIARGHLERALQIAPPEEGVAFEPLQDSPDPQPALVSTPKPLDKELAAEMGFAAAEPPAAPPAVPQQKLPAEAQRELDL